MALSAVLSHCDGVFHFQVLTVSVSVYYTSLRNRFFILLKDDISLYDTLLLRTCEN